MHRGKLIVVLALALAVGKVQCLAACTVAFCGTGKTAEPSKLPPCHRHKPDPSKQAPAPCAHHVLVTSAESTPVTTSMDAPPATIAAAVEPVELRAASHVIPRVPQTPSPPGGALSVLRI